MSIIFFYFFIFLSLTHISCTPISSTAKATGVLLKGTGQLTWKSTKVLGKTGWWATKKMYRGTRGMVYMLKGKEIIPLTKIGQGYYANVRLNRHITASLLVDTGATSLQLSRRLAQDLGVSFKDRDPVLVSVADGREILAYRIYLDEVALNGARVQQVEVLILDHDDGSDGLLGMSFLKHFYVQLNLDAPELILQQRVI